MKKQIQIFMLFIVVLVHAQQNRPLVAPINDEGVGAIDLINGNGITNFPENGTNINATVSPVAVSNCDVLSKDTWFAVTIPASGNLIIETSRADTNSIFDTVMSVFSGTLSNLTLVSCNDDLDGNSGFSRVVLHNRSAGEKLYVSVWRFSDLTFGNFKVSAYDSSILSNNKNYFDSVTLFPNPAQSVLNIGGLQNDFDAVIFNTVGQKILDYKVSASKPTIDVSILQIGTYLINLTNENQSKTLKFIKL